MEGKEKTKEEKGKREGREKGKERERSSKPFWLWHSLLLML